MRILIVRLGALGDIIHTLPAQQLLSAGQETEVHWLCEAPYRQLLEAVPGIHQVWAADTRSWRRRPFRFDWLELARELRREGFDLALDFQGLFKSAVLARASGAHRVLGFPAALMREPAASVFYSGSIPVHRGPRHQVDRQLDLVDPPIHDGGIRPHPIPLQVPRESEIHIEAFLEGLPEPPVVLNPGGGWATKRWPPERYGNLAERIESRWGIPVVLTHGPGEEDLIAAARSGSGGRIRTLQTSLFELAALCRRARLIVGGDTGPLHLAEALGTPVVAILGPALPWRTGPYSPDNPVVLHREPCPHPYRRRCNRHFCMDIGVERVLEAVGRALAGGGR